MSKQVSAFRGSIDGYYQVYDSAGALGPVYPAGNLTSFEIAPDADELEVVSTGNADYGQAADSMVDAKPTKCTYQVNRFNIDLWAVAFMGEIAARTAAETTVTDEEHTAVLDEMIKLDGLDVSAITLTNEAGTTTYVADTDYLVVDAALGLIKPLSTGSIANNSKVLADYTKAAEAGWLLSGGTQSSKFIRFFGRGINRFNNKRSIIEITKMSVKSNGAFSFVGTEAATMGFDATIITPGDGTAGYTIKTDA